ncbi:ribonuclease H-like domain-containing protein [Tanacetum coccineum]
MSNEPNDEVRGNDTKDDGTRSRYEVNTESGSKLASAEGSADLNAEPKSGLVVAEDSASHPASTSDRSVLETNILDNIQNSDTLGSIIADDISDQIDATSDDEKYDYEGEEIGKFDLLFSSNKGDPERVVLDDSVRRWVESMNKEIKALYRNGTWEITDLPKERKHIDKDVYMSLPEGFFVHGDQMVYKLKKSVYGLKQAPRKWNEKHSSVLCELGFNQSKNDHSLFVKSDKDIIVVLLV